MDTNLPFEYQTSPVFIWLLYSIYRDYFSAECQRDGYVIEQRKGGQEVQEIQAQRRILFQHQKEQISGRKYVRQPQQEEQEPGREF